MWFFKPNIEKLKTEQNVEGLIKALRYIFSRSVREAAAQALGKIGGLQVIGPLTNALYDDTNGRVRIAAAEALGQVGDARGQQTLITALKAYDQAVCETAAKVLGQVGDARAVEPLIALLKHPSWSNRLVAATALKNLYYKDVLDDQTKKKILAQQSTMNQPYVNLMNHDDFEYHSDYIGMGRRCTPDVHTDEVHHTDRTQHADYGIGVNL